MKKKILAGVLAAASALSMSVSAFAADDTQSVTGNGELEYDVEVAAPTVVLNLVMPAKLEAALNPYGADIVVFAATDPKNNVTSSEGIVSTMYPIINNSTDYGVYIDATATTTVSGKDWAVVDKDGDVDTKKNAQLSLVGVDDNTSAPTYNGTSSAATGGAQGALALISGGDTKGKTEQKKFMYLKAAEVKTSSTTPTTSYLAFAGKLATGDDIEWTEDDTISVSLVLKISAGPKEFPTP